MASKKLYVHFEESEPNYTSPFNLESSLTFSEIANQFCTKYNSKHGSRRTLDPKAVLCKVGSKSMQPEDLVSEHVNAGDDVFVVVNPNAITSGHAGSNGGSQISSAEAPLEKKFKVYVHYEMEATSKDANATQMFQITDGNTTVGSLIKSFVDEYNRKRGGSGKSLDAMTLCARTDSEIVVGAYDKVASKFKNNDDIWLVPIDVALKEDNSRIGIEDAEALANPIEASKRRARDKSYYYWAMPITPEAAAPREAPRQIRVREATEQERVHFKTIESYGFENADPYVKVYVTLPGVGSLPKDKFQCDFDVLSFSLRIFDYNGFNHRLQVPRLSNDIKPEESSFKVLEDTVVVRLRKGKDTHWFDLHKTRGIGES